MASPLTHTENTANTATPSALANLLQLGFMENGPPVRAASRWPFYTGFSNRLFSGNEKTTKFGDYT